jgi:hypothetical protein
MVGMSLPPEILNLFSAQHGVASGDQLLLGGLTHSRRHSALRTGQLERVATNVVRVNGSSHTPAQAAMTAVLDAGPGSILGRESCLGLFDTPGFTLEPFHIIRPRGGIRRDASVGIVHSSRRLPPHHVTVFDGIPATTPARALFDCAADVHPKRVERALDNLGSMGLVNGRGLVAMLDELRVRGRGGISLMEALIEERGIDWTPATGNERRLHWLAATDGQPPLRREVNVGDSKGWIARLDAYDDGATTDFEVDSFRYHAALLDQRADAERDRRLRAAGIAVVRFDEFRLWHRGSEVKAEMWAARQEGRRRNGQPLLVRGIRAA